MSNQSQLHNAEFSHGVHVAAVLCTQTNLSSGKNVLTLVAHRGTVGLNCWGASTSRPLCVLCVSCQPPAPIRYVAHCRETEKKMKYATWEHSSDSNYAQWCHGQHRGLAARCFVGSNLPAGSGLSLQFACFPHTCVGFSPWCFRPHTKAWKLDKCP